MFKYSRTHRDPTLFDFLFYFPSHLGSDSTTPPCFLLLSGAAVRSVEGVSDQKEQDAGLVENLDDTWVHRQESEIAKALNGALARDRKRNKILQKLSQLGERLTPEDAAEMARARLAAAEAAAAVGGTVAPKAEEPTFSVSKAGLPRSTEREEVNLRAFVKMDPDVSLEQLGLFAKVYAPSEKDAEEAFQPADSQKSVTISDS